MREQGQEDPDPNIDFDEKKLWQLTLDGKLDEAIQFLRVDDNPLTLENKRAAVNYKDEDNRTTLMAAAICDAPRRFIQRLCEIGGKPLIMATDNNGRTVLHYACVYSNIDTVKYLVQNGGTELTNKNGYNALDYAKRKGNDSIYDFLKDCLEFPFHALCSSIDVTASKIQEYLDQHQPSCVFQTKHVSKTPLHNLSLNQHAPSDAFELLIKAMLQTKSTGGIDLFKSTIKMAQDPTVTDNALSSLLTLVPNLTTALLSYYKRNPAENPEHASRIQKMITL